MQVKKLSVGKVKLNNNLFLAPMAGYTDYPFRSTIAPFGVGLAFTELVSAKGLYFGGKNTLDLIKTDDYKNTAVQIFGSDPYYMRWACESNYLKDYSIVDINMGCPVPKVYKNGEGSALLNDIGKAETIIKECVKSGKEITVKIRIGLNFGDDIALDFAKMSEQAGAKLITIHGRVREAYYSGEVNFCAIEKAKKSVNIKVIANGGIFTKKDADILMDNTGADGVMIARGAIHNPFIFNEILNKETKPLYEFIKAQLDKMVEFYGEDKAVREFRKFSPYYLKGRVGIKDKKLKLQTENSVNGLQKILEEIFFDF